MATRKVYFFNSRNRDRVYNADSMTDWLNPFFTTGVFNNCFAVTANNNMTVTVSGGYGNIGGKVVNYIGSETLDLEVASGTLSRIDNVILRRDDVNRDIYLMIQTGGLANNPVAPLIVRENGIYDLKLAEIHVKKGTITITQAEITDTRMKSNVCGWVMATIKDIDFAQITAQFNTFFDQYKPKIAAEYNSYVKDIDNFYSLYKSYVQGEHDGYLSFMADYEQRGRAAYDALVTLFENFKADRNADFQTWFDSIRGILSGDAAGNLLLLIQELQAKQPATTIGTVTHTLGRYPHCSLYRSDYALGVTGLGIGPLGGTGLVSVPAEFELVEFDKVTIRAPAQFAYHTEVHRGPDNMFSFTCPGSETNLILIMR